MACAGTMRRSWRCDRRALRNSQARGCAGKAISMFESGEENPQAAGFDPERLARLDHTLAADVEAGKIPGAVVLIERNGTLACWKAFGYRDREANVAMERNNLFRIASMTKPVTSVAVMMLAERGRLFLPEPVAQILPQFAETPVATESAGDPTLRTEKQARPMTVHDLLRHTAGLTYGLFGASQVKTAYNQAGVFDLRITNAEMVDRLAAIPLAHQPGRVWDYSMATDVLGRIVEVVSGNTLDHFFRAEIFGPLGMAETGFVASCELAARMAQPQVNSQSGQRFPMTDHTVEWPWQSGGVGLYSTASDYLKFCRMLLAQGASPARRLLGAPTVRSMTADHLPAEITYDPVTPVLFEAEAPTREMGQGFGLGFAVRTHAGMNPRPGSVGDYYWAGALGTYFWIDPAEKLIAIFMSQAPGQRLHYRYLMRQLVYQALEPRPA
jgi:CubicO group peptidase (beta-lactamase class C family)